MTGCCDNEGEIKSAVRELYAKVATGEVSCCGEAGAEMPMGAANVETIGYAKEDVEQLSGRRLKRKRGMREPHCGRASQTGRDGAGFGLGRGAGLFSRREGGGASRERHRPGHDGRHAGEGREKQAKPGRSQRLVQKGRDGEHAD